MPESPPKEYRETGATSASDYADPKNFKYPIHTEKNVRAAISYFSKPANAAKYSPGQRAAVWGRIRAAAKKFGIEIGEGSGPPSLEAKKATACRKGGTSPVSSLGPLDVDPHISSFIHFPEEIDMTKGINMDPMPGAYPGTHAKPPGSGNSPQPANVSQSMPLQERTWNPDDVTDIEPTDKPVYNPIPGAKAPPSEYGGSVSDAPEPPPSATMKSDAELAEFYRRPKQGDRPPPRYCKGTEPPKLITKPFRAGGVEVLPERQTEESLWAKFRQSQGPDVRKSIQFSEGALGYAEPKLEVDPDILKRLM